MLTVLTGDTVAWSVEDSVAEGGVELQAIANASVSPEITIVFINSFHLKSTSKALLWDQHIINKG